MRRYWVPKGSVTGSDVVLTGEVLHHIRDVCRQHLGSKFEILVEGGGAHLVEIISENKKESIARILESRVISELGRPHLHLVLSIPRFPVFEAVIEKAVELGVKSIQPLFSDFSFIRKQEEVFDRKRARFEKIVVSSTQQSGRGDLMPILDPVLLEDFLSTFNRERRLTGLFAYEGPGGVSANEGIALLKSGLNLERPNDVWLFAGSEGGFSDREVELFRSVGLQPVTLGRQILRVETACVALVSIIKYDFDLMR